MGYADLVHPYGDRDRDAVLAIFDSNTPTSFSLHERPRFERFLDDITGRAWVARTGEEGEVTGFGAVSFSDPDTAWLRWGMVSRAGQRRGIGRALLHARMTWIRQETQARHVRVATTEPIVGFFLRMGFALDGMVPDGIEPGVDRYDLACVLD